MKSNSLSLPTAAVALVTAAVFAITTVAQAPQTQQAPQAQPASAGGPPPGQRNGPRAAPTNLKVLSKDLTGDQVHEIMEKWADELGAHCNTCHTADPNNIGPNGRPRLNFADDSKPEKAIARLMFTMTEDINRNYVSKVPNSDMPVTCGTCHRGHLGPQPFVVPPDEHGGPPPAAPPSGATQPAAK